ncbi:MAG: IPT/TIG domain-containing protein [Bacteroidetes bacterium]|nr:IPT/TIG domain-containing protein [Bacteroidota bacterium]
MNDSYINQNMLRWCGNVVVGILFSVLISTCAKVNVFQEPPDNPVIDSIAPSTGRTGTQIRLYGTGFSNHAFQNKVSVNGVLVQIDSPSTSTVVLATINSNTGTGHVHISVNNQEAEGPLFTYDEKAISINSISPSFGWVDTTVAIRGVGFGQNQDSVKVNFGTKPATIKKFSDTLIIVSAPDATNQAEATVVVTVMVSGKTSNGVQFSYTKSVKPVITKVGHGWNEGGYSVNFEPFPPQDSSIKLYVNGVSVKPDHIVRDGIISTYPNSIFTPDGNQLLINTDSTFETNIPRDSNFAQVVVRVNDVPSDPYRMQIIPRVDNIQSSKGGYTFGGSDTVTFTGLFFGDRTLPSSIALIYLGVTQADPQILSWTNQKIVVIMPPYSIPSNTDVSIFVQVGNLISGGTTIKYLGASAGAVGLSGSTSISESKEALAAAASAGKIVFAGGLVNGGSFFSKTADIYDVNTGSWTSHQLTEEKSDLAGAAAGNMILFAGGRNNGASGSLYSKTVDIYNALSGTWSSAQLSEARDFLAGAGAGDKILFGGGDIYYSNSGNIFSNVVDIYNTTSGTWTTSQLSERRGYLAAAAMGNKIVFAGGLKAASPDALPTATVDIYDVLTDSWQTAQLSEARYNLTATAAGGKIFFAGGQTNSAIINSNYFSSTVDIYDVSANTWSVAHLSTKRTMLAATAIGNKVLFGGGDEGSVSYSQTVDVYDTDTGTWTTAQLSSKRRGLAAASSGNKALFGGGALISGSVSSVVDIFTLH